ncbi:hypothetical protein AAVH_18197 [Aphelenchoides avenae]|nr:hypothetical protein AAVH_18197 [Aphelenchus avenae]
MAARRKKLLRRSSRKRYTPREEAAIKQVLRQHAYLNDAGRPTLSWNRRGFASDRAAPTSAEFWLDYEFKAPFANRSAGSLGRRCAKIIQQLSRSTQRRAVAVDRESNTSTVPTINTEENGTPMEPVMVTDEEDNLAVPTVPADHDSEDTLAVPVVSSGEDDNSMEQIVRATRIIAQQTCDRFQQMRNKEITFPTETLAIATSMLCSIIREKWSPTLAALARHAEKQTIDNEDVLVLFRHNAYVQKHFVAKPVAFHENSPSDQQSAGFPEDRDVSVSQVSDAQPVRVCPETIPAAVGPRVLLGGAEDDFYDSEVDLAADAACRTLPQP